MLTACLLGFVLGLRHASDPDHVIAVSTIVARHRRPWLASWIGVAWGLGHSATLVGVGALVVLLHVAVPATVAAGMEGGVGVVLFALGAANLRAAGRPDLHGHAAHPPLPGARRGVARALARACMVGLAHGLAGSAAVALLALAAMPTATAALAYLAVFSLGTIGGMLAISFGVGVPLAILSRTPSTRRWIVACSGAVSLGFGAWIVWASLAVLRGTAV